MACLRSDVGLICWRCLRENYDSLLDSHTMACEHQAYQQSCSDLSLGPLEKKNYSCEESTFKDESQSIQREQWSDI